MDLRDLKVWKLLASPNIKRYHPSFSRREFQETQIHLLNFTDIIDMDTGEGHPIFPFVSHWLLYYLLTIEK